MHDGRTRAGAWLSGPGVGCRSGGGAFGGPIVVDRERTALADESCKGSVADGSIGPGRGGAGTLRVGTPVRRVLTVCTTHGI